MISFLQSLPLWVLFLALNAWLLGTAFIGMWLMRRHVLPWMKLDYEDAYYAAAIVQSVMLLFGLIAALVAVGNWTRYSQVSAVVSHEATAIASLWRDLGGYPEPLRTEARGLLRGYTDQVINEAWPKQQRGEIPSEGVGWMDRLQEKLSAFEPVTESHKIFHAEALHAFNELVQSRRERLDALLGALPSVLWFVLLPGAMGCVILCLFFSVHSAVFQAILLGGLASFMASMLMVIISLDLPFQGPMGIKADSYQLIYDHHMRR